ncbi:RNA-dependent ATPase [Imshaugia aleurites]|uniref:RNA helicase n=1 Tax=Imshaugia aleurites TaxID=172621 RepID=A0A8H3G544_9LECA|nr:RNA-dependent ATPase [Imshaugia aleurites]
MTEVPVSTVPVNENGDTRKSKKRKRGNVSKDAVGNGDNGGSNPSKEERREAKRLKKLAKKLGVDQGSNEDLPTNGNLEEVEKAAANGDVNEKRLSREARKEAKRLKKLAKEQGYHPTLAAHLPAGDTVDGIDPAFNKTTQKTEKARLKAEQRTVKPKNISVESQRNTTNGISKSSPGYVEDPTLTALPQSAIDDFLSTNFITISDPASTNLRPITKFSHLPSHTTTSSSPFAAFKTPTPIQSAAWPFLLSGRDVIGVAETGSGKTLAFGVPCIRSITSSPTTTSPPARAVIVSPTRELAVQIHTQMETLATPAHLSTVCVYGGVPKETQRSALKTAHIIVATPGRLNDLITEGCADLRNVNYVVLDEADRMLDKGFEAEIRKIIGTTPTQGRQTLMFTATWPPSVRALASTFTQTPVHISIGIDNPSGALRANTSITQVIEVIDPSQKEPRLLQLLKRHQSPPLHKNDRILVFCLYKKEAARITTFLCTRGHSATAIHGDMTQTARSASLSAFKAGTTPLLVATDVAARGLDIPSVKVVINVTFPLTVEDYVHRIGRTGRAGAAGLAVTLFTEQEKALSGALVNVLRAAGQEVPEALLRFGTTVRRKGHEGYGAFYKDLGEGGRKEGTKIRFD